MTYERLHSLFGSSDEESENEESSDADLSDDDPASYSTWEPPSASESETDDLPSDESEDEYKDNNSTGMRRTPQ
jgi:hypothetical protein